MFHPSQPVRLPSFALEAPYPKIFIKTTLSQGSRVKRNTVSIFQAIISRVIKLPRSLQYNRHETHFKTGREKISTDPARKGVAGGYRDENTHTGHAQIQKTE